MRLHPIEGLGSLGPNTSCIDFISICSASAKSNGLSQPAVFFFAEEKFGKNRVEKRHVERKDKLENNISFGTGILLESFELYISTTCAIIRIF